ncbi:MAG TPA: hypothetical protein VF043_32235 [Ktedonobacteraceae bacterium]
MRDNLVRLLPAGRKKAPHTSLKAPPHASSRQAAFLFLRRPEKLRVEEQETLARLRQLHLEFDLAYDRVQFYAFCSLEFSLPMDYTGYDSSV